VLSCGFVVLALAGYGHAANERSRAVEPFIATTFAVPHSRGLMVTSGGWAYCEQLRMLARRVRYTLMCGRYSEDGFLGPGLRSKRHLDWGNPAYLADFAEEILAKDEQIGGELILVGVSYSGFGVATLAAHHPEIRPDRLVVIDSYFDLVARRSRLPHSHETAREIDSETSGSKMALRARSAGAQGLARLVRVGTRLSVIWTVSEHERRLFNGATCNREASAATLAQVAHTLHRSIPGWVTRTRHGHNLWNHGADILDGTIPGRRLSFPPSGRIPAGATCSDGD
jgi:pimeloyl-ACP methyl ester carboxylesterase